MAKRAEFLDNPRVRFNWGFWDGFADAKKDRPARDMVDHFDPMYAAGYLYGYRQVEDNPTTSDRAWTMFLEQVRATDPEIHADLVRRARSQV